MLRIDEFIRAYREQAKLWVAEYRKNEDPEDWNEYRFYLNLERSCIEKMEGFEEEVAAYRRRDPEAFAFHFPMKRINVAAGKLCKKHYDAHEYDYHLPTPPSDIDYTPKSVAADWKPKYSKGFFSNEQGVLVIGYLILSWHTWKPGGQLTRTYYTVSLLDGTFLQKRTMYNMDLPTARKPLVRHAQAISVTQQLAKLYPWTDDSAHDHLSNKQLRALSKQLREILSTLGFSGHC